MTADPKTIAAEIMTDYARDIGRMDIAAYVAQKNDGIISASLIDEVADLIEKTGIDLIWPDGTKDTEVEQLRAEMEQLRESARYYSALAAERTIERNQARAAAQAERARIKRLLSVPMLAALRCVPDGEIRDGCVVYDGATVRERLRQAWLAIDTEPTQKP